MGFSLKNNKNCPGKFRLTVNYSPLNEYMEYKRGVPGTRWQQETMIKMETINVQLCFSVISSLHVYKYTPRAFYGVGNATTKWLCIILR